MPTFDRCLAMMIAATIMLAGPALGRDMPDKPAMGDHHGHRESAPPHQGPPPQAVETPPLPEGMTLDEVLDYSTSPPSSHFPEPPHHDSLVAFTQFDTLEYRMGDDTTPDHSGWEVQGWIGGDFDKFWWKHEGEADFNGPDRGETETDFLYSRLVTPFWSVQIGVQYANEWAMEEYDDRWSGVIALQGLAPYRFEIDASLVISEHADVTFECDVEYDLRITQRLVLQPRAELGFAARDIPERSLGAGMTGATLDLRLRYEIKREFAPYVGIRYRFLVGETGHMAEAAGADTGQLSFVAGIRFAF